MIGKVKQEAIGAIQKEVEGLESKIIEIGDKVWTLSELSLSEEESSAFLIDILKENDFYIDSVGTANVPTAFTASYGSGSPIIGIMTEYDALPELGTETEAEQTPRKNGVSTGYGCGNNLIGAGGIGSAIALKTWMKKEKIPGTIRVIGAGVEGAKINLARDGVYDSLDACLYWHPAMVTTPWCSKSTAVDMLKIEFFGKNSHAANAPWYGKNVLQAAELFGHGIALMREHLEPTARIHYVIEDGGQAPNAVVDYSRIKLFIHDLDRKHVEATTSWVKQMVERVAMATQTKSKALVYCGMHDLVPNKPMADRLYEHIVQIGLPEYTDEEIEFAKKIQESYGVEPTGMPKTVIPQSYPKHTMGRSTNVGEVSWFAPTMGLMGHTMPKGYMIQTWQATSCHRMSIGHKGLIMGTKAIASLGVDLFINSDFLAEVKTEFKKRVGDYVYKSSRRPIPKFMNM